MIDALLATLERDTEAEVTRIMDEARARAADLTRAAEQRMAERRAATLGKRETEERAQHERALAGLRLTARARVLEARAALLDRLFAALRATLPELARSPAYRRDLPKELERLSVFAGDQAVTIRCTPALTTTLQRLIKTNGHIHIRSDARIAAGFRVTTADGTLEVDGSLESRLERLRPRLALEALAALFA
jgi:V/A-type H+-transporting ATPase subunit E